MSSALFWGSAQRALSVFVLLTAAIVLPEAAESQEVPSPLQVLERIVRADEVLFAPSAILPPETGPLFVGFTPGETPTDETLRFFDSCTLEGSGWEGGSRETLFHFRAEGDLILDDGVLVEIESAVWEEEGVSVEFTSYSTRRNGESGSEIWAHPSRVLLAAPGAPGGNWALLSWTSKSGFPVERPLGPVEEESPARSPRGRNLHLVLPFG